MQRNCKSDNEKLITINQSLITRPYVEGNPLKYADSSGNSINPMLLGAIIGYMLAPQLGLTREQGAFLGAYAMSGNTNIGKDITGGLRLAGQWVRWASGGLQAAGDTYSNAVYGTHHNEKALTHGSALGNSIVTGIRIWFAVNFPVLSFIIDPAFTLGTWLTAFDLVYSSVTAAINGDPMPFIQFREGGYLVRNSRLNNGRAYVMGPYAFIPEGTSEAVIRHEIGHIKQYKAWGGWRYFTTGVWNNLIQGNRWMEHDADARSGQSDYPPRNDYLMYYSGYTFANQMGWLGKYGNLYDYTLIQTTGLWLLGFVY